MNDLSRMLGRAAEAEDEWALDPTSLMREGERRMARRRHLAAGVGAAVALVATVVIAGVLPGGGGPDIEPAPAPGEYREVSLSPDEMEARCTAQLNQRNGTDLRWVAGHAEDGTAVPGAQAGHYVETREGWAIELAPEGERWRGRAADAPEAPEAPDAESPRITDAAHRARLGETAVCLIPQAGTSPARARADVPSADDEAAILAACSVTSGYDVDGWQVLATADTGPYLIPDPPTYLDAVLMSDDGRAAHCWLRERRFGGLGFIPRPYRDASGEPTSLPGDADPAGGYGVLLPDPDPALMLGVVPGLPDGWVIEVSDGNGTVAELTTHHGGFAVARDGVGHTRDWFARVSDETGDLVWEGALDQ